MSKKILLKRGRISNLPLLDSGEMAICTDIGTAYFGSDSGNVELANKHDLDKTVAKLIENTKEIDGAKGNSESLKQELDNRFNLVNDNLKAQWLEQEGTNIKVLNSLNGTTRDLCIEGNTLQNLYTGNAERVFRLVGGQHYNELVLCKTSMLKLNTLYTLRYDVEILKNTTSSMSGDFSAQYGVGTGGATLDHPVMTVHGSISSLVKGIVPKLLSKFTITDFKGYSHLTIRPLQPKVRPVPQGEEVQYNIKNIVLLEGDYTDKPIPDYFEGIKSVGEAEGNKISISSHGKNLFNLDDMTIDKVLDPTTDYKSIEYSNINQLTVTCTCKDTNKVLSGSTYVGISTDKNTSNMAGWLYHKTVNPSTNGWIKSFKFTTRNNNLYFSYGFTKFEDFKEVLYNYDIQLEEGTTSTEFEEYKSDKKDISLPYSYGFKGLSIAKDTKIGNKIVQKVGRIVLDGSENIENNAGVGNQVETITFAVNISNYKPSSKNGICNKFKASLDIGSDSEMIFFGQKINIRIKKSKLETPDVAGFKKWLQANPTTVYYELATPVEHQLEEDVQLATYKDVTYISSQNSIESTNKCKVAVDRDLTTTRLINENRELEEENKKLTENQSVLAGAMLSILEPMFLPSDGEENIEYGDLLEKLNNMK